MNCDDIRRVLTAGDVPDGPEVEAHLDGCAGCRDLLDGELGRALGALGAEPAPSPDPAAFEQIEQIVAKEHGVVAWLRSRPTRGRVRLGLGMAIVVVAYQLVFSPRADLDAYPLWRMGLEVALFAGLLGLVIRLALPALQSPAASRGRHGFVLAAVLLAPLALALLPAAATGHPASLAGTGADFWPRVLGCFGYGVGLALPVLALLWALDRGEHRLGVASALAAGAAGVSGALSLHVHCAIAFPMHLVAGHATVTLVVVAIYFGGRRAFARR